MSNENNTYHTQHLACVQLHPLVVQLHCCSWVVLVVTVVFLTFEIHLCFYLWISMTFTCFYRAFHHCGKKELGICQFFFFFNFFFLLPVKELFLFQVTIKSLLFIILQKPEEILWSCWINQYPSVHFS